MASLTNGLLLRNVNVVTFDSSMPRGTWVVVMDGRISRIGTGEPPIGSITGHLKTIDCHGGTLLPGFNDAHSHVLASAASLVSVDCGPLHVSSIEDIKGRLKDRLATTREGDWVRAVGYNEFYLREQRHPNRWDLDQVSESHPVRLLHRSGHGIVLNSRALQLVGINKETLDPVDGFIERDPGNGEPTGLLLEMGNYLDHLIPRLSATEIDHGVSLFNKRCLSVGITSIQDATHENDFERWGLLSKFKDRQLFLPCLTLMVGFSNLHEFLENGLRFGHGNHGLRIGSVKIMMSMVSGTLIPSKQKLNEMVAVAHECGYQVAIHAVEIEAVDAAIDAIHNVVSFGSSNNLRHRIEHCSECPPNFIQRLVRDNVTVVTNPGFLYYSGERYMSDVAENTLPYLYPIGDMSSYGVNIAAGSDSPVIPANPLVDICSAVTHTLQQSDNIFPGKLLGVKEAISMYTLGAAYASFEEHVSGSIQIGKWADMVLLERDPASVDPNEIKNIDVLMTLIKGQVEWTA